eukprot:CAMPEP_0178748908 /NCGR_PEP_ID=MMETSP0744-20121128/9127_1 /TAXON_ID=913974 /ORGANISM="Nitzschia punctata, Strain CCMP561" /LENGTH=208 /DNA_ID=CAMNT_0020402285 /DNA_START=463 /DNA_END=1086 /DNA_ORIENTATION=-
MNPDVDSVNTSSLAVENDRLEPNQQLGDSFSSLESSASWMTPTQNAWMGRATTQTTSPVPPAKSPLPGYQNHCLPPIAPSSMKKSRRRSSLTLSPFSGANVGVPAGLVLSPLPSRIGTLNTAASPSLCPSPGRPPRPPMMKKKKSRRGILRRSRSSRRSLVSSTTSSSRSSSLRMANHHVTENIRSKNECHSIFLTKHHLQERQQLDL